MNSNRHSNTSSKIYHEKQRLKLCGLHSVNHLLQYKAFHKKELDEISKELHGSFFTNPLGNYDVNVLIVALQRHNLEVVWFDKRKPIEEIEYSKLLGLLVNYKTTNRFLPFHESHHWIAITNITKSLEFQKQHQNNTETKNSNNNGEKQPEQYSSLRDENNVSFYNCDSKLKEPQKFTSDQDVKDYLQKILDISNGGEVLLVMVP